MYFHLYVLSDRRLTSIEQWQQALSAEGFPLQLSTETPPEQVDGILAARWGERPADFKCRSCDAREVMESSPKIKFGRNWAYALAFSMSGPDVRNGPAALMAATAYARATGGILFYAPGCEILTLKTATDMARRAEEEIALTDAMLPRILEEMARSANPTEANESKKQPSSWSAKIIARRVN